MVGRVPVSDYGINMLLGRVAHVPFPSVLRKFHSKFPHVFVPVGLRQHGGRRNRSVLAVSLDHALVPVAVKWFESVSVDKQELRFHSEPSHSPLHSCYGCVEDVDGVDFFCRYLFDGPCNRFLFYYRTQGFPGLFRHLFRVIQKRMVEVLRQNNGSSEDRTGQRASARFVASRLDLVRMKKAQKMGLVVHSAKIHNLFFPIK